MQSSVRTDAAQHAIGPRQVVCFAQSTPRHRQRCRSRPSSKCRVSRDRGQLPVVDDADVTVLPPPPTGSQYAWRYSWRGSSANSGGGNGGRSGRSQARTRDWGSGPHSSLLLVIMYRIRMLLLYGVWITVLYGALHAITDLAKNAARCTAGIAVHAAQWANGLASRSNSGKCEGSNHCSGGASADVAVASAAEGVPADAAAAAAVACAATAGPAGDGSALGGAAATDHASKNSVTVEPETAAAAGPLVSEPLPEAAAAAVQEDNFAARFARAQGRPSAKPFTGLMSVIVPMYLMLMGSILFFASM